MYLRKTSLPVLILSISIVASSCDEGTTSLPKSSGKTAEMIVVTDNKGIWEGSVGNTVFSYFSTDYEVLPQPEPLFEMANVPLKNFQDAKMFRNHHNVLLLLLEPDLAEVQTEVRRNFWSQPQRVVKIEAPDEAGLIEGFQAYRETIRSLFRESDREKLEATFHAFIDRSLVNEIGKSFGFTMDVPSGFGISKNFTGFMWLRKETNQNSQGLMIYTYDYTDQAAFRPERIISFRNSVTKAYVPGPTEGSYMIVAREFIPPVSEEITFHGMYAVETRGLWEVENDFMGGPFVNITFVDERTNMVVALDGYVYAPNRPKRDLLIQMEAIIHSMKFSGE